VIKTNEWRIEKMNHDFKMSLIWGAIEYLGYAIAAIFFLAAIVQCFNG